MNGDVRFIPRMMVYGHETCLNEPMRHIILSCIMLLTLVHLIHAESTWGQELPDISARPSVQAQSPGTKGANGSNDITLSPLTPADKDAMRGVTWHPNCPVLMDELVKVEVPFWTPDATVERGTLVVHQLVGQEIADIFKALFDVGFVIESIRPIHAYKGSDDASMAANNTSAFNCRSITGRPGVFSVHSYGLAVDVNPVWNPYVKKGAVLPPSGRSFKNRKDLRPGMIAAGGPADKAFRKAGWSWGGRWKSVKDYQHFEKKRHRAFLKRAQKSKPARFHRRPSPSGL